MLALQLPAMHVYIYRQHAADGYDPQALLVSSQLCCRQWPAAQQALSKAVWGV